VNTGVGVGKVYPQERNGKVRDRGKTGE